MSFSKTGGTNTLSIKSNVSLEVTSNEDWCTVTPAASASATVLKYAVTVDENPDAVERIATITVKGGGLTETFNVVQLATNGLIVESCSPEAVAAEGGIFYGEYERVAMLRLPFMIAGYGDHYPCNVCGDQNL